MFLCVRSFIFPWKISYHFLDCCYSKWTFYEKSQVGNSLPFSRLPKVLLFSQRLITSQLMIRLRAMWCALLGHYASLSLCLFTLFWHESIMTSFVPHRQILNAPTSAGGFDQPPTWLYLSASAPIFGRKERRVQFPLLMWAISRTRLELFLFCESSFPLPQASPLFLLSPLSTSFVHSLRPLFVLSYA